MENDANPNPALIQPMDQNVIQNIKLGYRKLLLATILNDPLHDENLDKTQTNVCELHFRKEDVLRETEYFDEKSGTLLRSPLHFLRNFKVFILPHESTLRRVCSEFGVNPSKEQDDDSFLSYITQKFNFLGDKDKTISLMIDEIHLRPTYDYVGGELYVINNVVAEGLNFVGAENNILHHKETADYIKIIHRWWSVMNVKTKYKVDHKIDDFQKPLMKGLESDPKYKFLIDFGQWLKRWEKMDQNTGCLTKQTHLAISHTTEAMPALAKYCFDTLNFDYFLPGKIQADPLEDRFGSYRRLGSTNYNVSIRQIYEGEEKMRIQTILPLALKSNNYGKLTLSFFIQKFGRTLKMTVKRIYC
ncbi:hypothetical protein AVEN_105524-1 [Araneus ventricosus]|uniref:THAP-type domain-containing protein n=1 Tax=Araneus ventricosus TaxID=182803 RepID=A0A4Y2GLR3_ARAVE|nr:hypothetical protein AVEN_105524-1 [Araneus ventricosus]